MLEKVLANQIKSKKMLSRLTETVGSHIAVIQKLESQMHYISREQHPPKKGGLSSDTILNPKNGGGGVDRVFAISTWSGKILQSAKNKVVDLEPINEEEEVQSDAQIIDDELMKRKLLIFQKIRRLVKKKEDAKFEKIYGQLKQLSINFPFLDAVKEMTNFAKYLKDLLTKKKMVQYEIVSLTHTMSFNISTTTVKKKGNPGAFTIPCSVGYHDFTRALCDIGMADRSIKKPVGRVDDVLVRVGKFMLPVDSVILGCAVDRDILIILGRPFLATGRALMDSEKNEIKF
ncbi:uncharacterized protein LOC132619933 [Lycium barbarum]|uniref:uncharacterized protein LOC132619933 n=1 Tax=Lycium barbarum TaxID=112863 RepID=UPI00293EAA3E|nr:uncharacterized protein LOC132619933 [Lycium barbarum]